MDLVEVRDKRASLEKYRVLQDLQRQAGGGEYRKGHRYVKRSRSGPMGRPREEEGATALSSISEVAAAAEADVEDGKEEVAATGQLRPQASFGRRLVSARGHRSASAAGQLRRQDRGKAKRVKAVIGRSARRWLKARRLTRCVTFNERVAGLRFPGSSVGEAWRSEEEIGYKLQDEAAEVPVGRSVPAGSSAAGWNGKRKRHGGRRKGGQASVCMTDARATLIFAKCIKAPWCDDSADRVQIF